jgi:hypothetical protein
MTDKNGRPLPGPRCVTCHREALKARKASSHERRVQEVYGLAPGDYDRLYEAQGGTCAICRRARGIARKLAVDHDHRSGRVRGLLCSTCNKILGHLRDDSSVAYGIYSYLTYYPAQKLGIVAYHQDNRKEGPDG